MFVQLTSRLGRCEPTDVLGSSSVWENGNLTWTLTSWTVSLHFAMTFRWNTCSGPTSPWVSAGIGKLASVPAGGAVAVSAAPGSAAPAAGSAPAAAEEKKEEKKEESEESDDDMGFGLFD
ncbi:hypothetical protein FD755_016593 [Muntiacus reevesi]|uniref:60S acidic ribosomal protein P2 n=1 Tax=Muntiacus reevesi TaxID=9886 RepID=A0A5N3XEW3_MUNRE|nr:hypothetical protein FD755_016593 [Muntiacus reevesi]